MTARPNGGPSAPKAQGVRLRCRILSIGEGAGAVQGPSRSGVSVSSLVVATPMAREGPDNMGSLLLCGARTAA